jgi:hypothetical protein
VQALTYYCAPGRDLTMLVNIGAKPGEHAFLQFTGPIEKGSYFTIAERAIERISGPAPHLLHVPIPDNAPEGTYQLRGLSLILGYQSAADFDPSHLMQVFLKVALVSPATSPRILHLERPA